MGIQESKKRTVKWDNAKAGLIFLVVFGHFAEIFCEDKEFYKSMFFFIYTFHMPAFIFITGMLGRKRVEKLDKYKLIPLFILSCILHFLRFFAAYISNRDIRFRFFDQTNISWYLFAIVVFYIIAHFLKDFSDRYVICSSILLAMIAGYDSSIGSMLALSRIFTYFPFFYLGYIIGRREAHFRDLLISKGAKAISAGIIAVYGMTCVFKLDVIYKWRPLLSGLNHYYTLKDPIDPFWGGIYRLVYYFIVVVLVLAFLCIIPEIKLGAVSIIGQKTLSIYFWHLIIIQIIRDTTPFYEWIKTMRVRESVLILLMFSVILLCLLSLPPFTTLVDRVLRPSKREIEQN